MAKFIFLLVLANIFFSYSAIAEEEVPAKVQPIEDATSQDDATSTAVDDCSSAGSTPPTDVTSASDSAPAESTPDSASSDADSVSDAESAGDSIATNDADSIATNDADSIATNIFPDADTPIMDIFADFPLFSTMIPLTADDIENLTPGPDTVVKGYSESSSTSKKIIDGKVVEDTKNESKVVNNNGNVTKTSS